MRVLLYSLIAGMGYLGLFTFIMLDKPQEPCTCMEPLETCQHNLDGNIGYIKQYKLKKECE